jgi:xanthine dehydrogenase molybdopterin-binding subunit B
VLLLNDDWPILANTEVRHVGEPVALVAAASRLDARKALAAVEAVYTPLDPVLDLSEADPENPLAAIQLDHGDVERALGAADLVVEGEYRTGHQEHIYIECQAMTAWYETEGTLMVKGSMQCPYYVHKALVHALELPPERVRVEATVVGGGFGGKEDYPSLVALHAALLAKATDRPVRIAYDRHEDIVGTTKRHPSIIRHLTGVDKQGRLQAMDIGLLLDGGSYTTLTPVVLSRAARPRSAHQYRHQWSFPGVWSTRGPVCRRAADGSNRTRCGARSVGDSSAQCPRSGRRATDRPGFGRHHFRQALFGEGRRGDRFPAAMAGARAEACPTR